MTNTLGNHCEEDIVKSQRLFSVITEFNQTVMEY